MQCDFNDVIIDRRKKEPVTIHVQKRGDFYQLADGSFPRDSQGKKIPVLTEQDLTFQYAAGEALYAPEQGLDVQEKRKRAKLVDKVFDTPACEVSEDEVSIIKHCIGLNYGPLVVDAFDRFFAPKVN